LTLASDAMDTGTLAQAGFTQGRTTVFTELTAATVDEQLLLEVARFAIPTDEVAQRSAAALDGTGQDAPDLFGQFQIARPRYRAGGATRVDPSGEQRLAGVDIAHSHHDRVIHDEGFDRHAAPARHAEQPVAVKFVAKRLRPQARQ